MKNIHHNRAHDEIVNYMHNHIEEAMKDQNHPLHISNTDPTHFVHNVTGHHENQSNISNVVKNRASTTYNQNMKDAALSAAAILQHHHRALIFAELIAKPDRLTSSVLLPVRAELPH